MVDYRSKSYYQYLDDDTRQILDMSSSKLRSTYSTSSPELDYMEKKKKEYESLIAKINKNDLPTEPRTTFLQKMENFGGNTVQNIIEWLPGSIVDRMIGSNIKTAVTRAREGMGHDTFGVKNNMDYSGPWYKTIWEELKNQGRAFAGKGEYNNYNTTQMYSELFPNMAKPSEFNWLNPGGIAMNLLDKTGVGDRIREFAQEKYDIANKEGLLSVNNIDEVLKGPKILGVDFTSLLRGALKGVTEMGTMPSSDRDLFKIFESSKKEFYNANPWTKAKYAYLVPGIGAGKALDLVQTAADTLTNSPAAIAGLATQIIDDPLTWIGGIGAAAKGTLRGVKLSEELLHGNIILDGIKTGKILKPITVELANAGKGIEEITAITKGIQSVTDSKTAFALAKDFKSIDPYIQEFKVRYGSKFANENIANLNKTGTPLMATERVKAADFVDSNQMFTTKINDEVTQILKERSGINAQADAANPLLANKVDAEGKLILGPQELKGQESLNFNKESFLPESPEAQKIILDRTTEAVRAKNVAELSQDNFLKEIVSNPDRYLNKGGINFLPGTKFEKNIISTAQLEKTKIPQLLSSVVERSPKGVQALVGKMKNLMVPAGNAPQDLHESFLDLMKTKPLYDTMKASQTIDELIANTIKLENKTPEEAFKLTKAYENLPIFDKIQKYKADFAANPEALSQIDNVVKDITQEVPIDPRVVNPDTGEITSNIPEVQDATALAKQAEEVTAIKNRTLNVEDVLSPDEYKTWNDLVNGTKDLVDESTGNILKEGKRGIGPVGDQEYALLKEYQKVYKAQKDVENFYGYHVNDFPGYLPAIRKSSQSAATSTYGFTPAQVVSDSAAFEKAKHFENITKANEAGMNFEDNFFKLMEGRTSQHIKAIAQKDFIDAAKGYGANAEMISKWNVEYDKNFATLKNSTINYVDKPAAKISFTVTDANRAEVMKVAEDWKNTLPGRKFTTIITDDSVRAEKGSQIYTYVAEDVNQVRSIIGKNKTTAVDLVKQMQAKPWSEFTEQEKSLYQKLFKEYPLGNKPVQARVFNDNLAGLKGEARQALVQKNNNIVASMARAQTVEKFGFDPNALTSAVQDVPSLAGYKFTPGTGEYLNRSTKFFTDQYMEKSIALIDPLTRWWKAYATVVFPGFHSRNFQSNMFNLTLKDGWKALDPAVHEMAIKIMSGIDGELDVFGKTYKYTELKDLMDRHGMFDWTMAKRDVGKDVVVDTLGRKLTKTKNVFSVEGPAVQIGMKVSGAIEGEAKAVGWLNDFISTGDAVFAAKRTNEFLFNYSDISRFSSTVLKRLFPFITWTLKDVPLQWKNLLINPAMYALIPKVRNYLAAGAKVPEGYWENQPEYYKSTMAMPTRFENQAGNMQVYNPGIAFQDLAKLAPSDYASMLTPIAKMAVEFLGNKQMFSQEPIFVPGSSNMKEVPKFIADIANKLPDNMVQGLLEKTQDYEGNPTVSTPAMVDYLLSQIPLYSNMGKAFPQSTTSAGSTNAASMLFGTKFFNYNPDTMDYYRYKDAIPQIEALIDFYKKTGQMPTTVQK